MIYGSHMLAAPACSPSVYTPNCSRPGGVAPAIIDATKKIRMDPNTGVLSREPHRVVAVVVAPDLTGAWMSVRDNGGTLWWTVTFVSSENQVHILL